MKSGAPQIGWKNYDEQHTYSVEDEHPEATLQVGDFVRCVYELYHYYYPSQYSGTIDEDDAFARYGVVLEIDYARFGDIFGYEVLYLILCLDGVTRFYSEYEVQKICWHSLDKKPKQKHWQQTLEVVY